MTQLSKSRPGDLDITEQHLQRLFAYFRGSGPIEVYDVVDRCQLDIATHIFFGESTDSLDQEEQPFRDAMDTLCRVASVRTIMGYVGNLRKRLSTS